MESIQLENKIIACIKYKNFASAIFLATTYKKNPLLLPILLYENREYSRALFHLRDFHCRTANFYKALCYKAKGEYEKAITHLLRRGEPTRPFNNLLDIFLIGEDGIENYYELLGELYTQAEDRTKALEYFKKSVNEYILLTASRELIMEEITTGLIKNTSNEYFRDRILFNSSLDKNISKKYIKYVPGIGSYFLMDSAKELFERGRIDESKNMFEFVRAKDIHFLDGLDVYSTLLWHSKDISRLGVLCNHLVDNHPYHHITWTALGNYFSHRSNHSRAVLCFQRSKLIRRDHYILSLLGHEFMMRNEFKSAIKHFLCSIKMYTRNYNASFGCGIAYSKTNRPENAEFFFKRSLEFNPTNPLLRLLYIQFLIRAGRHDHALDWIAGCFGVDRGASIDEMVRKIKVRVLSNARNETEDLILLELVEILIFFNLLALAMEIMEIIKSKGKSYDQKNMLIKDKISNKKD
ncbi:Anaphase-promoting complex subunit 3 [Astathelohania contejeani]|uniref:Anaphase-promoting complex subunit 3 n=1 Tax=Astathelohania contejeani TaxID=164912 RepID=A0ABQ7HYY7_9MICR|nr:Anaphase-promoting complex subunit 3 [Thelohania contejeani]